MSTLNITSTGAVLEERRPSGDRGHEHEQVVAVRVRQAQFLLAWDERDRLLPTPVYCDVGSVEVRPIARIKDWVEAAP